MPDANVNQLWARAIVEELERGGVEVAVVCPGSRSSPLALACADAERIRTVSIIDERSAGFFALGHAKFRGAPVALVATSGSAGAHFLPAVIEAAMAHVPLIILTADRPPELQGWGAPQTVPQARLFGEFARSYLDLGVPEARDASLLHLRACVALAAATARKAPRGAVQLNVPFREPLAPTPEDFGAERLSALATRGRAGQPFTRITPTERTPDVEVLRSVVERIRCVERGLIVCGPRDASDGFAEAVQALSGVTGYPILAEATSQVRYGGRAVISLYDGLLRNAAFAEAHRPERVLRFGGGLTSKVLQAWLDASGAEVVVFSDEGGRFDPAHRASLVIEGDASSACRELAALVASEAERSAAEAPRRGDGPWAESFLRAQQLALAALDAVFAREDALTEPRIAREVVRSIPAGATLFVSSSMPIRDVDAFTSSRAGPLRVLANRGANGIDGIVSSALGVAAASGKPAVLLTGDLAFLHDLGGLLTARREHLSLAIVVVNNDGGGIFSFLPIAQFSAHFEKLFGTPHQVDVSHAAALFGAKFHRSRSPLELRGALQAGLEGGLHLIEVRTSREANVTVHRELFAAISSAAGEGPWT